MSFRRRENIDANFVSMKSLTVLHDDGTSRTSFLFFFERSEEDEQSSTRTRGGVLISRSSSSSSSPRTMCNSFV
jgi:hypothetical protein